MDKGILVTSAQELLGLLDGDGMRPRAMLWVSNGDTGTWKLWIVPPQGLNDQREFYRRLAATISGNRAALHGLEASQIEMIAEGHPAMKAIRLLVRVTGKSDVHVSNSMLNGFYVPDAILVRQEL